MKKNREYNLDTPKKVNVLNTNLSVDKLENHSLDDININSLYKGNETFNMSHFSYKSRLYII
jgi:hypothetical protein